MLAGDEGGARRDGVQGIASGERVQQTRGLPLQRRAGRHVRLPADPSSRALHSAGEGASLKVYCNELLQICARVNADLLVVMLLERSKQVIEQYNAPLTFHLIVQYSCRLRARSPTSSIASACSRRPAFSSCPAPASERRRALSISGLIQ